MDPTPAEILGKLVMSLQPGLLHPQHVVFRGHTLVCARVNVQVENQNPFPVELLSTRIVVGIPGNVASDEIGARGLVEPGESILLEFSALADRADVLAVVDAKPKNAPAPCFVWVHRVVRAASGYAVDPDEARPRLEGLAVIQLDRSRFDVSLN